MLVHGFAVLCCRRSICPSTRLGRATTCVTERWQHWPITWQRKQGCAQEPAQTFGADSPRGHHPRHSDTSLVHLDIGYNKFTKDDVPLLAEALKKNHTIFGLHVAGNGMWVDSRGFLHNSAERFKNECALLPPRDVSLASELLHHHHHHDDVAVS